MRQTGTGKVMFSLVPEIVWMSASSKNDKDFLGQLNPQSGEIYVFDKGYVNYNYYFDWTGQGIFFVTRLNENARYEVLSEKTILQADAKIDGILKDQLIELQTGKGPLQVRLVTFLSLTTGKTYTFVSNMFEVEATTIANLIFTVIHRQTKQAETFSAMSQMARVNMASFIKFIDVLKQKSWRGEDKDIGKIQLNLFQEMRGVF
jgi:hypothetical protein